MVYSQIDPVESNLLQKIFHELLSMQPEFMHYIDLIGSMKNSPVFL